MYTIPDQLTINNFTIQTFGLFLLFGFVLGAFIFWKEGKKDGFSEERLFDLYLLSSIGFVVGWKLHPLVALLGFILPIFGLCRHWKWSVYRIMDIFALSLALGSAVSVLGFVGLQGRFEFLIVFALYIFVFAALTMFRSTKLKSGYSFVILIAFDVLMGLIFFRETRYLPFYLALVTLSLLVFLFRNTKGGYEVNLTKRLLSIFKRKAK